MKFKLISLILIVLFSSVVFADFVKVSFDFNAVTNSNFNNTVFFRNEQEGIYSIKANGVETIPLSDKGGPIHQNIELINDNGTNPQYPNSIQDKNGLILRRGTIDSKNGFFEIALFDKNYSDFYSIMIVKGIVNIKNAVITGIDNNLYDSEDWKILNQGDNNCDAGEGKGFNDEIIFNDKNAELCLGITFDTNITKAVRFYYTLDSDDDGVPDETDNCVEVNNPNQEDTDNDGLGNACDNDDDDDSIYDLNDSCPLIQNYGDLDQDGIDDACDSEINYNSSLGVVKISFDFNSIPSLDNTVFYRNEQEGIYSIKANGVETIPLSDKGGPIHQNIELINDNGTNPQYPNSIQDKNGLILRRGTIDSKNGFFEIALNDSSKELGFELRNVNFILKNAIITSDVNDLHYFNESVYPEKKWAIEQYPDYFKTNPNGKTGNFSFITGDNEIDFDAVRIYYTLDLDDDGVPDEFDNCPETPNSNQWDADKDGVGNVCDNCVGTSNEEQVDSNENGIGDACEIDCPEGTIEEIIVPFRENNTSSINSYQGNIELNISGVGNSSGKALNDAFYVFTDYNTEHPITPIKQNPFNLYLWNQSLLSQLLLNGDLNYNSNHEYSVKLLAEDETTLDFKNGDSYYSDNGGAYKICVTTFDSNCGNDLIEYGEECETNSDCDEGQICNGCMCELDEPTEYCGDGVCNNGETCSTCSTDCGACSSGNGGGLGPYCGDGVCNGVETNNPKDNYYCEQDCGTENNQKNTGICTPSIEYSDWSDCVDGSQTRTYTVTNDCDNEPKDLVLEQKCETEPVTLSEGHSCNDNNPCTKGRWYERTNNGEGHCVFDYVNGINCYKDGVIGVCNTGKCVVPEPKQTETKKEIVKKTNTTTGFFNLGDLTSAGIGLLFLILLALGYAGYKYSKK